MKRILIVLASSAIAIGVLGCTNEEVGTIGGTVAGGLIGSTIGGGTGRTVATIGGAVVGGLVGNQIGESHDNNH